MSSDQNNNNNSSSNNEMDRRRRGSVTQQALAGLFRSNSTSVGSGPGPNANFQNEANRRRLSISTTAGVGLGGTSPTNNGNAFNGLRRGSLSTTNSDSIDENAVDEDEGSATSRTGPNTPFARRMSLGAPTAMRNIRSGGASPGSNGTHTSPIPIGTKRGGGGGGSSFNQGALPPDGGTPISPPPLSSSIAATLASSSRRPSAAQASNTHSQRTFSDTSSSAPRSDQGFNWSEQLRSRAENSVQGGRASFAFSSSNTSTSPPRGSFGSQGNTATHDRAKSVSDMPQPPNQAASAKQTQAPEPPRQKPDAFQERILKGDFYMD